MEGRALWSECEHFLVIFEETVAAGPGKASKPSVATTVRSVLRFAQLTRLGAPEEHHPLPVRQPITEGCRFLGNHGRSGMVKARTVCEATGEGHVARLPFVRCAKRNTSRGQFERINAEQAAAEGVAQG